MPSKRINGNNPLRVDLQNNSLQGAFADMSNEVARRTPRQGMTAGSIQVHNGVFHVPKRRRITSGKRHAFQIYSLNTQEGTCKVETGVVNEKNIWLGLSAGVMTHTPEIGSASMTTYPDLTIADGDYIYLVITTDSTGLIDTETPPEVIASATSQTSTHEYPDDPSGSGQGGVYYFEIGRIGANDAGRLIVDQQTLKSDLDFQPSFTAMDNVGSGAEVVKEFDEGGTNAWILRSIIGDGSEPSEGEGESVVDLYINVEQEDDEIKISGKVAVPDSSTPSDPLPSGSEGDMLYHDGSGWVVLDSPAAPGTDEIVLLSHTGTAPEWVTITKKELDVCGEASAIEFLTQ